MQPSILSIVSLLSGMLLHTGTHLSEERAVQRARDFCARVGISAALPASAVFPSPEEALSEWGPPAERSWRVEFGTDLTVNVVDVSGTIRSFFRLNTHRMFDDRPAGDPIREAEAIRRAGAVLAATGYSSDLAFWRAQVESLTVPTQRSTHLWRIEWRRVRDGVPYVGQGADVLLQADTGEPVGGGVGFFTPPAPKVDMRISMTRAAAIAAQELEKSGLHGFAPQTVEMMIVPANTAWEPGGNSRIRPSELHCAWVFKLSSQEGQAADAVVDVDARSGAVVGGGHGAIHSARFNLQHPKRSTMSRMLSDAKEVRLTEQSRPGIWDGNVTAIASEHSDGDALRAFASTSLVPTAAPTTFADCKLIVISATGQQTEMPYWSASGVLSSDFTHFAVPRAFREWAQAKLASAKAPSR